jgi:hypothetical protein
MSRAEQIRGKLFGNDKDKDNALDGKGPNNGQEPRPASDNPLTIKIPPPPLAPAPTPRPKLKDSRDNKTDSSPKEEDARDSRSFRERLVEQLGTEYHGAERYRLVQDDAKELHWKRWGPYVSDRQWVSLQPPAPSFAAFCYATIDNSASISRLHVAQHRVQSRRIYSLKTCSRF